MEKLTDDHIWYFSVALFCFQGILILIEDANDQEQNEISVPLASMIFFKIFFVLLSSVQYFQNKAKSDSKIHRIFQYLNIGIDISCSLIFFQKLFGKQNCSFSDFSDLLLFAEYWIYQNSHHIENGNVGTEDNAISFAIITIFQTIFLIRAAINQNTQMFRFRGILTSIVLQFYYLYSAHNIIKLYDSTNQNSIRTKQISDKQEYKHAVPESNSLSIAQKFDYDCTKEILKIKAVQYSPVGIIMINSKLEIIECNEVVLSILNCEQQGLVEKLRNLQSDTQITQKSFSTFQQQNNDQTQQRDFLHIMKSQLNEKHDKFSSNTLQVENFTVFQVIAACLETNQEIYDSQMHIRESKHLISDKLISIKEIKEESRLNFDNPNQNFQKGAYHQISEDTLRLLVYQDNDQKPLSILLRVLQQEDGSKIILLIIDHVWQDAVQMMISEQMAQKMKIFRSLSHEFRTPLNCSISMLEVLQRYLDADLISKFLVPALNSNKILLNFINDMLDMVQLDEGKFQYAFHMFNIKQFMIDIVKMVSFQAERKGIQIHFEFHELIPQIIKNDSNRIRQVLLNFLSNALQFTKRDGIITISLMPELIYEGNINPIPQLILDNIDKINIIKYEELITRKQKDKIIVPRPEETKSQIEIETPLPINYSDKKYRIFEIEKANLLKEVSIDSMSHSNVNLACKYSFGLRISVSDTGIGISEKNMNSIFNAFNKIDLGEKSDMNPQGCGLGLLISQNIAKGLNPTFNIGIEVQSQIEIGSSFSLFIDDLDQCQKFQKKIESLIFEDSDIESEKPLISEKFINSSQSQDVKEKRRSIQRITSGEIMRSLTSFSAGSESPRKQQDINDKRICSGFTGYSVNPSQSVSNRSQEIKQVLELSQSVVDEIVNFEDSFRPRLQKHFVCEHNHSQILIVDDNAFNGYALSSLLETFDLTSEVAHSGIEGLEQIELKYKCDSCDPFYSIIFMDIEMPEMDGYQTTEKVIEFMKSQSSEQKTIIIACTGYVGQQDQLKAAQVGMNDFASQPIMMSTIEQILSKWKFQIS